MFTPSCGEIHENGILIIGMSIASRAAERSLTNLRARAEEEVAAFIDAGLAVLRRKGGERLTVADVLAEAHRSTRAFYRHFRSKDELVLAIYERESQASTSRLRARLQNAGGAQSALASWIDETLSLAYDAGRARRTHVLAAEAKQLQQHYPAEFAAIADAQMLPLVEVLERGRAGGDFPDADPALDARCIHAVTWALAEERLFGDSTLDLPAARAQILRFCLPALGAALP
jgi:AcrR family transcriptional regulator